MKKNNIINEYEIFKVRDFDNVMIDYRTIGDTDVPVVVVDDFYDNPENVRDFALSLPYTKSKYICNYSPGKRVRLELDIRQIRDVCYHLLKLQNWQIKPTTMQVIFNKMRSDESLEAVQTNPHIDGVDMLNCGMVLYLNTEDECKGGTSFYRHKKTGLDIIQKQIQMDSTYDVIPHKRKNYKQFITESNEEWELIDFINMKFNRMVVYPPNVFHSAYINKEDFLEYDRLTQLGFF